MAVLSVDGYVRITFEAFQKTEISHLFSGIDEDRPSNNGVGANYSAITGYTEWVSNSSPAITIGWDWTMTRGEANASLVHAGIPGSNLMFLDQHNQDLGPETTRQMLSDWLDIFGWQSETMKALSI